MDTGLSPNYFQIDVDLYCSFSIHFQTTCLMKIADKLTEKCIWSFSNIQNITTLDLASNQKIK